MHEYINDDRIERYYKSYPCEVCGEEMFHVNHYDKDELAEKLRISSSNSTAVMHGYNCDV